MISQKDREVRREHAARLRRESSAVRESAPAREAREEEKRRHGSKEVARRAVRHAGSEAAALAAPNVRRSTRRTPKRHRDMGGSIMSARSRSKSLPGAPENKDLGGPPEDKGETLPWVMKISPEDYLARYPKGPHAPLAREHAR